ncbi:MAG: hypothetical protein WCO84_01425 [bacterium]
MANIIKFKGGGGARVDYNGLYGGSPNGILKTTPLPTSLSVSRTPAGGSIGNYALFAGGDSTVDAYNYSLTRTTPTSMTFNADSPVIAMVGDYALVTGNTSASTVNTYNLSLTRGIATDLQLPMLRGGATNVGNYALFGGGYYSGQNWNLMNSYNTSLTKGSPTALSVARNALTGGTIGNYALFAGGRSPESTVDAYDSSLTRSTPTALSASRGSSATGKVIGYVLFAGGSYDSTGAVDAYNSSLTRTVCSGLGVWREFMGGSNFINLSYALFGGGNYATGFSDVWSYDSSLTKTSITSLSLIRYSASATNIGNYVLFAGSSDIIDAYENTFSSFYLYAPIGSKYDFGGGEQTFSTNKISVSSPATGYIKFKKGVVS